MADSAEAREAVRTLDQARDVFDRTAAAFLQRGSRRGRGP
jgi:hypothetical protein